MKMTGLLRISWMVVYLALGVALDMPAQEAPPGPPPLPTPPPKRSPQFRPVPLRTGFASNVSAPPAVPSFPVPQLSPEPSAPPPAVIPPAPAPTAPPPTQVT